MIKFVASVIFYVDGVRLMQSHQFKRHVDVRVGTALCHVFLHYGDAHRTKSFSMKSKHMNVKQLGSNKQRAALDNGTA